MWYVVLGITGSYPPAGGSLNAFKSRQDAETFAAQQYAAQIAAPEYPPNWWLISEAEMADGWERILGYPSPYAPYVPPASPNTPLDVAATTDGANFTVSWTPNNPPYPETYVVTATIPASVMGPAFIGSEPQTVTMNVNGTSVTIAGVAAQWNNGEFTSFNDGASLFYACPVTFTVYASNEVGQSNPSAPTSAVTAYGSPGLPAAPTNVIIAATGTYNDGGDEVTVYTISWDQPYPDGAGIPTGWYLGSFSGPVGTVSAGESELVGFQEITASGTPSTGSYSVWIEDLTSEEERGFPAVFAYNTTGVSASPYTYTNPS